MIQDIRRAFATLENGPAKALLPTLTDVRLSTTASPPLEGEAGLLAHAPMRELAELAEEAAAYATMSLAELLAEGLLRGWLTCQSAPCLIDGCWTPPANGGLVLDADLAAGSSIGLHIRHLGRGHWRVGTVIELLATADAGEVAVAEPIAFLGRERDRDADLVLHYRRYWQCTAEGEPYAPSCRLQGIVREPNQQRIAPEAKP